MQPEDPVTLAPDGLNVPRLRRTGRQFLRMVRIAAIASDCKSDAPCGLRTFESFTIHHFLLSCGSMVQHPAVNRTVRKHIVGSNPTGTAILRGSSSSDKTLDCRSKNEGLIPFGPAIFSVVWSSLIIELDEA